MVTAYPRFRALAGALIALSGLAQTAMPWMAVPTTDTLLTALCGSVYLLLALGLFGIGSLSLLLAMLLPTLRVSLGLWPLPVADAEMIRIVVDLLVSLLCAVALMQGLRNGPRGL